jgi:hypothetical protein
MRTDHSVVDPNAAAMTRETIFLSHGRPEDDELTQPRAGASELVAYHSVTRTYQLFLLVLFGGRLGRGTAADIHATRAVRSAYFVILRC